MMRKTQTSVTSTVLGMSPAVIFNLPDRCTEDAQTEMHLKTGDGEFSFYLSSNSGVRAGLFFPPPPPIVCWLERFIFFLLIKRPAI